MAGRSQEVLYHVDHLQSDPQGHRPRACEESDLNTNELGAIHIYNFRSLGVVSHYRQQQL